MIDAEKTGVGPSLKLASDAEEFDAVLGVGGLHRGHRKVVLQQCESMLPPELFQRFQQQDFWRDLMSSRAHIITVSNS